MLHDEGINRRELRRFKHRTGLLRKAFLATDLDRTAAGSRLR